MPSHKPKQKINSPKKESSGIQKQHKTSHTLDKKRPEKLFIFKSPQKQANIVLELEFEGNKSLTRNQLAAKEIGPILAKKGIPPSKNAIEYLEKSGIVEFSKNSFSRNFEGIIFNYNDLTGKITIPNDKNVQKSVKYVNELLSSFSPNEMEDYKTFNIKYEGNVIKRQFTGQPVSPKGAGGALEERQMGKTR